MNEFDTKDTPEDRKDPNPTTPHEAPSSWSELGLGPVSLEAIERLGYHSPTEVQQKAIPLVADGGDLIVQAKTGSGKTLAFGLPILERLDRSRPEVQALVLAPTRELAMQVAAEITRAGQLGNREVLPIFGGASMNMQIQRLKEGARLVVGTPGRILDHLSRGTLRLEKISMLVLDEADEMLDRGFLPDVMKILEHTPRQRQTMLFSATMPAQIRELAERHQREPRTLLIGQGGMSINYDIHHGYIKVPRLNKFAALVNVLYSIPRTKVLIFCNTKAETENVAEHLHEEGFAVGFLLGDLPQSVRNRTLGNFKEGIIDILVATDVAARGIDIFGVSHVINYDVPENKDLYVHRTGRTGRAGRRGEALTLVGPHELLGLGTIQKTMGFRFEENEIPTKTDVSARLQHVFLERLRAMEAEGYPEDVALYADRVVEELDPYTAVAGLFTLLKQHGFDFNPGYDPDNPEPRARLFTLPKLLGQSEANDNSPTRRGEKHRERGEGRSKERSRTKSEDREPRSRKRRDTEAPKSSDMTHEPAAAAESPKVWMRLPLGTLDELSGPRDVISLICQNAGVKKGTLGRIEQTEHETRFELQADCVEKVIDALARRKKGEPLTLVKVSD